MDDIFILFYEPVPDKIFWDPLYSRVGSPYVAVLEFRKGRGRRAKEI
jgi:hypothetical protein